MKNFQILILILFLTSCAVQSPTDKNNLKAMHKLSIEQEGQRSRALYHQALQQLREGHPEASLIYEQAYAAESRGEFENAIGLYHKAMQQAPENGLLLTSLGMVYLRNEDIIPARRYLLRAVGYDPDYFKPKLGLGYIYLQNQQLDKAITQLKASLQLLPTVEGTFLLAEAEQAQGDLTRAKQLYQAVVQVNKNSKLGKAAATRLRSLSK
jgi:tetratricopeptide (TPR) repeat protein